MSIYRPYNPNKWGDRKAVIKIIEDLRNGDSFSHFKEKFYNPNGILKAHDALDEENKKRLYTPKGAVDEVISKLVSFCPILTTPQTTDEKNAFIKKILNNIQWKTLSTTIYDILESKGDCFLYYYFDETQGDINKSIPYISVIPTEEISDIVTDDFDRPVAYIWKTKLKKKYFDIETKSVKEDNPIEVIVAFEKGKVTMLKDDTKYIGRGIKLNKKGDLDVIKSVNSQDSISNLFSILHIKSNSVPNCPFSRIPADKYIDDSLRLDQIESDIRASNRIIGFPKIYITDGKVVAGNNNIGGMMSIKSDRENVSELEGVDIWTSKGLLNRGNPQAQVKDVQIKNDLRSMFKERDDVYDSVHEKAGLTPPSLNVRLSSSDSSKVYQQINRRMEQKIQGYLNNISTAFIPFFESCLKLANLWDESDIGYTFLIPENILRDSAYDTALTNSIMLKSGEETIQSLKKKQGYTDKEVSEHINQINEEIYQGKIDIYTASNEPNKTEIQEQEKE